MICQNSVCDPNFHVLRYLEIFIIHFLFGCRSMGWLQVSSKQVDWIRKTQAWRLKPHIGLFLIPGLPFRFLREGDLAIGIVWLYDFESKAKMDKMYEMKTISCHGGMTDGRLELMLSLYSEFPPVSQDCVHKAIYNAVSYIHT